VAILEQGKENPALYANRYGLTLYLLKAERRDALVEYGKLVRKHAQHIGWLEGILVGKTRKFSMFEIDYAVEAFTCGYRIQCKVCS
jgi:hypothetical protein